MPVGVLFVGNEVVTCRASKSLGQSTFRWRANRKAATFRLEKVDRRDRLPRRHGAVCMAAAVEAPEAQKDKQEPEHQTASPTPLRREEAILFQGDCYNQCNYKCRDFLNGSYMSVALTLRTMFDPDWCYLAPFRVWMEQLPGWWLVEDCAVQDPGDEGDCNSYWLNSTLLSCQSIISEGYYGVLMTNYHTPQSSALQLSSLS